MVGGLEHHDARNQTLAPLEQRGPMAMSTGAYYCSCGPFSAWRRESTPLPFVGCVLKVAVPRHSVGSDFIKGAEPYFGSASSSGWFPAEHDSGFSSTKTLVDVNAPQIQERTVGCSSSSHASTSTEGNGGEYRPRASSSRRGRNRRQITPRRCLSERTVEQIVPMPVPSMMEELVEITMPRSAGSGSSRHLQCWKHPFRC